MKKFLSILLAVMMVLSTVSFAAPSAVGTMESATETPVLPEVPYFEADEADLAATAGDKSSYGTLVYSIDFERDDFDVEAFSTAYAKIAGNPTTAYMNPDFPFDNTTAYTNAAGDGFSNAQLVTEGDNTYITGDVAANYDGFFRMTKYSSEWPDGYYTFSVDVKAPAGQVTSFAQQCNDTAIALTTLSAFDTTNGDWQTVVNRTTNVVRGKNEGSADKEGLYAFFVTPNNATAGTVAYDNWEVYYRPATVTLTIDGNEYEVSTDAPVTVASLASKVVAPTGYILSGLSLEEGGELIADQYFFEDATLYPVFVKDPYMSDVYGKALFVVDFETAKAQQWYGHTSTYDNAENNYGAWVYDIASYYDARFEGKNFRVRFITNEGTHGNQGAAVDDEGNHYNIGTTLVQWPNLSISNWGSVTGEPGVYTYVFKRMVSGASSVSSSSPAGYDVVDGYDGVQGVWDTVVVQKQLDATGNIPDGNIMNFSLAAADIGVAEIAYDDLYLYYKPLTADVTLIYNGEEYVAEDVSTEGISADTILAAAGLEIPYGKKAVLSATNGGESVGNVVTLVADSTYYVSFVADDSISEYGKRLFLIDLENLDNGELSDNKTIDTYTDDFNGDWAHLTINWEVGDAKATVSEEDGNKIVKGTQGWAQIRINNANFESAPAGYYTMEYKTKNYGYPTEAKTISARDQNTATDGKFVDTFVDNGEWDTVAAEWDYAAKDYTLFYTAAMSTDVAFDDIALYYRPAKVNLTVVDIDGTETVYEDCNSVVDIDTLLADIAAPFGYKAALSIEKNGEPITGTLNLVSDAKLYVVLVEDKTVSFDYGKALVVIDFEREDMQGWAGTTQEIANTTVANGAYVSTTASYYDERFEDKNYRVRFVANETTVTDQKTVVDANGNHYTSGTNTTVWPQVGNLNYGNVQGTAGYYTYVFDTMVEGTLPTSFAKGSSFDNLIDGFGNELGVWDRIVVDYEMTEDGNLLHPVGGTVANFTFSATNVATVSFDNFVLYYKPYAATVKLTANGEAVKTVENVDTAGVLVSELLDGVKVKGYTVLGVKLGTTTYGLEDTVAVPCDCAVELVLEEQAFNPATPTTAEEKSIRIDDPVGIRFKASLLKLYDESIDSYGWVVARADILDGAELTVDFDSAATDGKDAVVGYGRKGGDKLKEFYDEDDSYAWFTGVLFFSAVESDGLPSVAKLESKLVARPFVVVDDEYLYGDATEPTSIYDMASKLYDDYESFDSLDGALQNKIYEILDKVDYAS